MGAALTRVQTWRLGQPSRVCGDYGYMSNKSGRRCMAWVDGDKGHCWRHEGKQPELPPLADSTKPWGLGVDYVDPGEVLLQLISQSAARVQMYSEELGRLAQFAIQETEGLRGLPPELAVFEQYKGAETVEEFAAAGRMAALTAPDFAITVHGEKILIGRKIRSMVVLERDERKLLADWCHKAISSGLEERRVKLAESQGSQFASVVRAFMKEIGLTEAQMALAPAALQRAVTSVFGGRTDQIEGQIV